VHALRHHLQALENALQHISQNAERQITALRQAEAALSNLDGQLVRISNSLLQADPSKPDDLTSRLEDALSILETTGSEFNRRGKPQPGRGAA
jgi:CTP-dependent riboflavin kinase